MTERVFDKTVHVGNRRVRFEKRSRAGMGRFGGGWQYKIGAQWSSSRCIIINLLIMSVRIDKVVDRAS